MPKESENRSTVVVGTKLLLRGAGWTYLAFFSRRLITFLSTIVLARIVGPEAFGLMAAALLMLNYADTLSDAGVGSALIQRQDDIDGATNAAFTISIIVGSGLSALFFAAAPSMALWFGREELTDILRVLSPIFLISAFSSVQDAWLKKTFRFLPRVVPQVGRALIKAVASITIALMGYGVWSLVWGHLIGQFLGAVLYWYVSRRAVRFSLDRVLCFALLGFGLQMCLVTLLGVVANTLDQLIVGRALDLTSLGIYAIGAMLPELLVIGICTVASQVVFPAYSRVQNHARLLRTSYLISLRLVTLLTFAVAAGTAIIAKDFMSIAYDERWQSAVPVIQVLSLSAAVQAISFNAGDVFKAIGRPSILTFLSIAQIAVAIPVLLVASAWGLTGIAIAKLVVSVILTTVTIAISRSLIGVSVFALLRTLKIPIMASLSMILVCEGGKLVLGDVTALVRMTTTIVLGAATYGLAVFFLDPGFFRSIRVRTHSQ